MTDNASRRPVFNTDPDIFVARAQEQEKIQAIQKSLKLIIQDSYPNLNMLIRKIESNGLPVIIKGPQIQLKLAMMVVGAQLGFISPDLPKYNEFVEHVKRYLPEKSGMDFSNGMLIALKDNDHFPFVAYHFYHALAFQNSLAGYEYRARQLYSIFVKKYHSKLDPKFMDGLDKEETDMLKMAIRRDKEALQFLRHLLHEVFIPVNNSKLIEKGQAQA